VTEKADQRQCCIRKPGMTDVGGKSGATGMQQWHKGLRCNLAATSEEGDDNRQWHQRTNQDTGATSRKPDDIV
jgi:hypothetical protein